LVGVGSGALTPISSTSCALLVLIIMIFSRGLILPSIMRT
jgi:hypothetical protein